MPYKDPEKVRESQRERSNRYKARKHIERYGPNAGDMRGKHGNHATGPQNARWNDGVNKSSHGYLKIKVGKRHPLADPNGYAYVHLLVWCAAGNTRPSNGQNLHHKNGIKTDNRIGTLELIDSSQHMKRHMESFEYPIVICDKCQLPVSENWIIQHLKSNCKRGVSRKVSTDPAEWPEDLRIREYPT